MRQWLGLVAIVVRDYDEAIAFYAEKLGFELVGPRPLAVAERLCVAMASVVP